MKVGYLPKRKMFLGVVAIVLFALSGCTPWSTGSSAPPAAEGSFEDLPPVSSTVGNYEDIEIPSDMKYSTKKSMSIRTESFRGGIIHYTGRVEMHSLKDFIISSMKKNKWKLAGEVASDNVILAFTKPNKTCMMKIENNGTLSDTTLTMYVTVDVAAAASLNAFGEPVK